MILHRFLLITYASCAISISSFISDETIKQLNEVLAKSKNNGEKVTTVKFFQTIQNVSSVVNQESPEARCFKYIKLVLKIVELNTTSVDEDQRLGNLVKDLVKRNPSTVVRKLSKSSFEENLYFWYRFDDSYHQKRHYIVRTFGSRELLAHNELAKSAILAIKAARSKNIIPNNKFTNMILSMIKTEFRHRLNAFQIYKLDKIVQ